MVVLVHFLEIFTAKMGKDEAIFDANVFQLG